MSSLLLDADAIIGFHQLDVWKHVKSQNTIYVSSIIAYEAYYYEAANGTRHDIDLKEEIAHGAIDELSATAEELEKFGKRFDPAFQGEIHAGEKEALLLLEKNPDLIFCTCDRAAIIALALLGLDDKGISFEKVLQKSGLNIKNIELKYTQKRFKAYITEGIMMRIQRPP